MEKKEIVKIALEAIMLFFIAIFLLSAFGSIFALSGDVVRGSEFGMLIDLVKVANKILVILSFYILHRWFFGEHSGLKIFSILKNIRLHVDDKAKHN